MRRRTPGRAAQIRDELVRNWGQTGFAQAAMSENRSLFPTN
jgi:hypothetical protein